MASFKRIFSTIWYVWNLGDHYWLADTAVVHRYYRPGTYTVKLGVVGEAGQPEQAPNTCGYKRLVVLPRRESTVATGQ